MANKKLWKFLRTGLKSDSGESKDWVIGKWRKEKKIDICHVGFHASKTPLQALSYVKGEILARVEVKGESIVQYDKECWSEMRIIKAYHWKKEDSVAFSIYAAELVIDIFEKKYPTDNRPRKAIASAKAWLANPTDGTKRTAAAAAAAYAAAVAADAAYAAAYADATTAAAAAAAAYAAAAAAAAAYAAVAADAAYAAAAAAAYAAAVAADAAEKNEILSKLDDWMEERIKSLEEYK